MPKRQPSAPTMPGRAATIDESEQPHARPVTMQEIGARCGYHKATVQRVLAGLPGISASTRDIILKTAQEMGYTATLQLAARRLALQKHGRQITNNLVALVFPKDFYRMAFFTKLFHGIMEVLTEEQFDLVTIYHRDFKGGGLPHSIARGDIDGLLAFGHVDNCGALIQNLRAVPTFRQRPIVSLILSSFPGCSTVLSDERQTGYQATTHLLSLGHRAIAHNLIDPHAQESHNMQDQVPHATQRFHGCAQACHEFGVNPDAVLIPLDKFDTTLPYSERMIQPLYRALDAHPRLTALIASNDLSAVAARNALVARGLRVPDDFSIIGCDDTDPMLDPKLRNILTTVHVPLEDIGREAARLLLRRITNEDPHDKTIILPTQLVVRGSTAPPRATPA